MEKGVYKNVVCVPLEALAGEGASEPMEGDNVEFAATGVIKSVKDGVVDIEVQSVGGEDVISKSVGKSDSKEEKKEMSEKEMEDYLVRNSELEAGEIEDK